MRKKIWNRLVSIVTILLVAGTASWAILNYSASKALERELTAIKDSGCPLSLEGFATPTVPDEENAYILYKKAFDMFDLGEGEEKAVWEEIQHYHDAGWLPEDKAALKNLLGRNNAVFEMLTKAAACRRSRIPVKYNKGIEGMGIVRMQWVGHCMRLLLAKALVESDAGRVDDAVGTCQVGLHLANVLYQEPILIAQLIRIALQAQIYQTLEVIFSRGEPSLSRCRALLEEVSSCGAENPMARALELELMRIDWVMEILKGESKLYSLAETPRQRLILRLYSSWLGRPLLKKYIAYGLRVKRDYIQCYKLPYHEAREAQAKWLLTYKSRRPPWYSYIVTHEWVSRFSFLATDRTEREALARIWQLGLAIRIYSEERGAYPESLQQLSPVLLEELPKDPFSGGQFLYRQKKDRFVVYSVGENLKDDSGEEDDIAWPHQKWDTTKP